MLSYPDVLLLLTRRSANGAPTHSLMYPFISVSAFALNQPVGEWSTSAFVNIHSYPAVLLFLTSRLANGAPTHSRRCGHIRRCLPLCSRSANGAPMEYTFISGGGAALNQAVGECSTNACTNVLSYPVVLLPLRSRSANGVPTHSRIYIHIRWCFCS